MLDVDHDPYRARRLAWDSEFFGLEVWALYRDANQAGRSADPTLGPSPATLPAAVELAYCFAPAELVFPQGVRDAFDVGYRQERVELVKVPRHTPSPWFVHAYTDPEPSAALRDLARASGHRSRFARDPRFPRAAFLRLYDRWIEGAVADSTGTVLVASGAGPMSEPAPSGFVSVSQAGGAARIGLIAVGEDARGRGLATALLNAAEDWAAGRGAAELRVVTQGDNVAALRLYARAGFSPATSEMVYHLWRRTAVPPAT